MKTSHITHTSISHLNQLSMKGKIALEKIENRVGGFYAGTWYIFKTLTGQPIHEFYSSSGFGLPFDTIKLSNPFTLEY